MSWTAEQLCRDLTHLGRYGRVTLRSDVNWREDLCATQRVFLLQIEFVTTSIKSALRGQGWEHSVRVHEAQFAQE